jgi:hypothetical protein
MFTERASSNPGASTPLAHWVHVSVRGNSNYYNYDRHYNMNNTIYAVLAKQEETLRLLLEFSKGEDLGLVNSEGDTPLHAVVRYGADHIIPIMLSCRPDLLFRENASGRTPYEMAEDAHLAQNVFNDPPDIQVQQHRYYNQKPTSKILQRSTESFVQEKVDPRNAKERVWDVCREFKEKSGRGKKRKLVSLLEANEVAKRLAGERQRIGTEDEGEEEGRKRDEVDVWYTMGVCAEE